MAALQEIGSTRNQHKAGQKGLPFTEEIA